MKISFFNIFFKFLRGEPFSVLRVNKLAFVTCSTLIRLRLRGHHKTSVLLLPSELQGCVTCGQWNVAI